MSGNRSMYHKSVVQASMYHMYHKVWYKVWYIFALIKPSLINVTLIKGEGLIRETLITMTLIKGEGLKLK